VVVGYDKIEPVIVANVALGKSFILIGRHGTCKTTLARTLAQGYGGSSVVYDATKDDIISICGIPKTKALEEGRFEFARGERTIWGKQLIVIDELGRATKENQNILLEILQERTCFGQKLDYKIVIATMNPETYAASLRLDEALLDRFYAVLPVPDFARGVRKETILKILEMNFSGMRQEQGDDFGVIFKEIETNYRALLYTPAIYKAVLEYTSIIMELIKGKTKAYISNRKSIHLAEEIFAIGAYMDYQGENESLVKAAKMALEYTVCRPAGVEMKMLLQCHNSCKGILAHYQLDEANLLRYEFARMGADRKEDRIKFVLNNISDIAEFLKEDEGNLMMGYVLDNIPGTKKRGTTLVSFLKGLEGINGYDEVKRKAEGSLIEFLSERKSALMERFGHQKVSSPEQVERVKRLSKSLDETDLKKSSRLRKLLLRDDFDDLTKKNDLPRVLEELLDK